MTTKEVLNRVARFVKPYKVADGDRFELRNYSPDDTSDLGKEQKEQSKELLAATTSLMAELQDKLYAQNRWGVLLIFQAMDAAGKDSTIKHVMSGINPQGCQVFSFKQPSAEELDHDYMWRYHRCLPERGRLGIFNRSYYEEVLVVRVHEHIFKAQNLPDEVVNKNIWKQRLDDIRNFEQYLAHNGIVVLKFFLNVSKEEQKKRFLARLDHPEKNWKFSSADVQERHQWDTYMHCFEEAIRATATKETPWFVVPADHKWFTRLVVSEAIVHTLEGLNLEYPSVTKSQKDELARAREILDAESVSRKD